LVGDKLVEQKTQAHDLIEKLAAQQVIKKANITSARMPEE